jgi:hypothetical protein
MYRCQRPAPACASYQTNPLTPWLPQERCYSLQALFLLAVVLWMSVWLQLAHCMEADVLSSLRDSVGLVPVLVSVSPLSTFRAPQIMRPRLAFSSAHCDCSLLVSRCESCCLVDCCTCCHW